MIPLPFAVLRLKTLTVTKFLTKDELVTAVQEIGVEACIALRWHEGAEQWAVMEMSSW